MFEDCYKIFLSRFVLTKRFLCLAIEMSRCDCQLPSQTVLKKKQIFYALPAFSLREIASGIFLHHLDL